MLTIVETVPWRANDDPISVAEMKSATKDLQRFLSDDEREKLTVFLAFNPEGGDVVPGTGGVLKTRWPYKDKGKSSGLRIMYFFHDLNMPLYILAVYSKGETLRLTKREELQMHQLVKTLVREHAERNQRRMERLGDSA